MKTSWKMPLKAGVVLLGMTLAVSGALAVDEQGPSTSDPVDFGLLMAPNLGSGSNDTSWYDDLPDHRRPNRAFVRLPANPDKSRRSGLAVVSVSQVFHGDLSAEAALGFLTSNNHSQLGNPDDPLVQIMATSIGNLSTVNICMFSGCEDVVAEDVVADNETDNGIEELTEAEDETLNLAALMAPSLGATVGPIDWDAVGGHTPPVGVGVVFANIRPFARVLVRTSQILVGDVSSNATVDTVIASPTVVRVETQAEVAQADVPQAGVPQAEVVVDLPQVEVAATSIGNAASFDTDVDANVEADQIVVGAVTHPVAFDTAIEEAGHGDNLLSKTLLGLVADNSLEKSAITAAASAYTLVNALVDVSATAVANSYTIGENAMSIDGFVYVDVDQFAYADVSANAYIDVVALTQTATATAVASALGNVLSATSR